MFKLVLEKAEEPEIKLPTSVESWKKQKSSRKTSISALLTMPKPLTVWLTINCGKFWKRWEYQTTWPASWEICTSGGYGIPVEIFQILKDDAVKVLHSICQQIWKTQQWPQDSWTEEPGGLQSMGLQRVGHDWAHTHIHQFIYQYNDLEPRSLMWLYWK